MSWHIAYVIRKTSSTSFSSYDVSLDSEQTSNKDDVYEHVFQLEMCGTSSGPGPEPGPGPGSRSWSQKIKLYRDCGRDRDQRSEISEGPGPKILI
jgi:hypothetical protein